MKKICSVVLAILLLAFAVQPAFCEEKQTNDSPVIYIIGRTNIYNTSGNKIPYSGEAGIGGAVKECLPEFAKAVLFGQWNEYEQKLQDVIFPMFAGFGMTPELKTTGGGNNTWNKFTSAYASADLSKYQYAYDARRSPLDVAADLNAIIEKVKAQTGSEKVSIISRCLGANVAMAYIAEYQRPVDYAGLDNVVFYDGAMNGLETIEGAFSGNITITREAASAFLKTLGLDIGEEKLNAIVSEALKILADSYGIVVTAELVEKVAAKLKNTFMRDFLQYTLASAPGYWSMCDDGYEDAKRYVFGREGDAEKWTKLIEKADAFHYNVQEHNEEFITEMVSHGVDVNVVCKYGQPAYPISGSAANAISDSQTSVWKQSFGAKTSTVSTTLGSSYIRAAEENGKSQYISPDKQIDASVCLLPANTWFISNYEHDPFYTTLDPFLYELCHTEGITVNTDELHPRFLIIDDATQNAVPQTEENCDANGIKLTDPDASCCLRGFFTRIINRFRSFFNILKILFCK